MMEFNYRSVIDFFYCEYENKQGENCKFGRFREHGGELLSLSNVVERLSCVPVILQYFCIVCLRRTSQTRGNHPVYLV